MFDHILVPLDGSTLAECVLPHVLSLAQASGSQVTLLHVIDQETASDAVRIFDPIDNTFVKAEAKAYLDEIAARLKEAGLQTETVLTEGQAAKCIIRYAQQYSHSLIALSSHGRSGLSGWNISSVVQKVLLRAYRSVLIIPAYLPVPIENEDFGYLNIIVPLDGSRRAEWVIPIAMKLVTNYHASLLLAHVVPKPEMPSYLPLLLDEIELSNRIIERNRQDADEYLKRLSSELSTDLFTIETRLVLGENSIETLHELVEQENPDLVIISAHGSTSSDKRPYGSTTLSFIMYGTAPLLILQDLYPQRIIPTQVELAAREHQGH
jgi:nucleotide-binding universal stress UspA family protein